MDDPAWAIAQHGREQHSLVTWGQLRAAGATKEWIEQRVREGSLVREAPAVYRPWGVRRTWEMRALAAVLSARAPALVSHRSAARLWGITGGDAYPGVIDVTVPRHRRPRARIGVRVHETTAFDLAGAAVRHLVPVTGVARTVLDCCAVLDGFPERLELLDEARRLRLVGWNDLWECLLLHDVRGRHGVSRFRQLLLHRDGEAPPGSVFARRMATLLVDAGLPTPVFEHPVATPERTYHLDLAWLPPLPRVGVECHGRDHDGPRARERDPQRLNAIRLAGWFVLEFRWPTFVADPDGVVVAVRQSLCA